MMRRHAAKAIITQSFPPAWRSIFALKPKPTHRKKIFWVRSFIREASKEISTMPMPLIRETRMEKIIPETTGAGIAYFLKGAERATMARPRKMTMAAKPSVHKYSNLNDAAAPSAAGV